MEKEKVLGILCMFLTVATLYIFSAGYPVEISSTDAELTEYLWYIRLSDVLTQGFILLCTVLGIVFLEREWPWI